MQQRICKLWFTFTLMVTVTISAGAQREINYDESKVPQFDLPDVLTCQDGTAVTTKKQWEKKRRPELLRTFYSQEYGFTPEGKVKVQYELLQENKQALDGTATQQQVMITFSGNGKSVKALMLVFIPNQRKGRVPVFIGYNFRGNHSMLPNEEILYSPYFQRMENRQDPVLVRNNQASRWPLKYIISRGYALVTMCYQDIFPDNKDGGPESITALLPETDDAQSRWQALGAWAWGSSRIADWVVKQPWANKKELIIMGHSRQGKASLWAGAQDKRFKVVISNDSGCGGAALSKRCFGETVASITSVFPHWFCKNFNQYAGREEALPFDQHELLALVAPRYLYVASAELDDWADQKGEFLSAHYASVVYNLYGLKGITTDQMPGLHQPIMNHVGYHIRAGKHDVTQYDWKCYMDFCDKAFNR